MVRAVPAVKIEPMRPGDVQGLQALFRACHPGWPARPDCWYFAHPTLVARAQGRLIGSTSMTVSVLPMKDRPNDDEIVLWGRDVCVHPRARGQGLGFDLCDARLALGKELGLTFFVGMTWEQNAAMRAIFERQSCTLSPTRIKNAYPGHIEGLLYTRGI